MLGAINAAAPLLAIQPIAVPVSKPDDFEAAFTKIAKAGSDAVLVGDNPAYLIARKRLAMIATAHPLPTLFGHRELVASGGLMSYGPSLAESFHRAAGYVDKIRRGAKPADLPVEQASKFELVINVTTARSLGLSIAGSLMFRADQLIE